MPKLKALNTLPDVSGKRFGNLSLGYDRVTEIRDEVSLLSRVAARVCGVEPHELTTEMLEGQLETHDGE